MESRRSARIATTFWVALEGVDSEPSERRGDISATGIYFETEADVGHPGTVHWLHLGNTRGGPPLKVMAYVVRRLTIEDIDRKSRSGVALAFMPESDAAAQDLCDFVKHVVEGRDAPHLSTRTPGFVAPEAAAATLKQLSVRSMTLETSWSIATGEVVRVDIVPPGSTKSIRLSGRARSVVPIQGSDGPRFQIEVAIEAEKEDTSAPASVRVGPMPREDIGETLDDLFSKLIQPTREGGNPPRPARELSGLLARVRLPTLCSLFELERMSGRLLVENAGDYATMYLREGQIVSIDSHAPGDTRAQLRRVFAWATGTFEFYAEPVNRPNEVGMSTTALILDMARVEDESRDLDVDEISLGESR